MINGYSSPRFEIRRTSDNSFVRNIDLPLTNQGGLVESAVPEFDIEHTLITGEIRNEPFEDRLYFSLDYSQYFNTNTGMIIYGLYRQFKAKDINGIPTFRIFIIPRVDELARKFEVIYAGDSLDIGISVGGINARFHKSLTFRVKTKELTNTNWIVTSNSDIVARLVYNSVQYFVTD